MSHPMSMRAPYILLSSSKAAAAAAARAFHPSVPSPVRGSSGGGGGSEKGKTSCDFGVSRALPPGHEKGYYRRVASSSLLWRSEGGRRGKTSSSSGSQ